MSFFEKITQEFYDETANSVMRSVAEQLATLFSNRHDKYWAYDFIKQKPLALHEVFKFDYYSPEFAKKLAYAITVFDTRVFDVQVSVAKAQCGAQIFIECKARCADGVIKIPVLTFDL